MKFGETFNKAVFKYSSNPSEHNYETVCREYFHMFQTAFAFALNNHSSISSLAQDFVKDKTFNKVIDGKVKELEIDFGERNSDGEPEHNPTGYVIVSIRNAYFSYQRKVENRPSANQNESKYEEAHVGTWQDLMTKPAKDLATPTECKQALDSHISDNLEAYTQKRDKFVNVLSKEMDIYNVHYNGEHLRRLADTLILGKQNTQIAQDEGISVGTISSQLSAARLSISKLLNKMDGLTKQDMKNLIYAEFENIEPQSAFSK